MDRSPGVGARARVEEHPHGTVVPGLRGLVKRSPAILRKVKKRVSKEEENEEEEAEEEERKRI